jgi:hypothetical protein
MAGKTTMQVEQTNRSVDLTCLIPKPIPTNLRLAIAVGISAALTKIPGAMNQARLSIELVVKTVIAKTVAIATSTVSTSKGICQRFSLSNRNEVDLKFGDESAIFNSPDR